MKTRRPLLAALILLSALLCACTPPDKVVILVPTPVQTHDSAFDPTPAPVDVDFSACTQALEAVPFSPYEWELPIEISMYSSWADALPAEPVEMACAMQNMQGVVFVGTEEDGRQFLAAIDLERAKAKRLYTLEAGMRVTSLVQTKKYGRADETGAFTWTETDGDAWRLRLYDERLTGDPAADAALLGETTLEQGALSQGDAFLPAQSSAELADDLLTFALLSQGEPTLRTASHGGMSYPLPGAEPVCYAGAPVCKVGEWNLVYLEERDGVRYFCFATLDEGAQRFAEVFRASYRLPEGEEIVQIGDAHGQPVGLAHLLPHECGEDLLARAPGRRHGGHAARGGGRGGGGGDALCRRLCHLHAAEPARAVPERPGNAEGILPRSWGHARGADGDHGRLHGRVRA